MRREIGRVFLGVVGCFGGAFAVALTVAALLYSVGFTGFWDGMQGWRVNSGSLLLVFGLGCFLSLWLSSEGSLTSRGFRLQSLKQDCFKYLIFLDRGGFVTKMARKISFKEVSNLL